MNFHQRALEASYSIFGDIRSCLIKGEQDFKIGKYVEQNHLLDLLYKAYNFNPEYYFAAILPYVLKHKHVFSFIKRYDLNKSKENKGLDIDNALLPFIKKEIALGDSYSLDLIETATNVVSVDGCLSLLENYWTTERLVKIFEPHKATLESLSLRHFELADAHLDFLTGFKKIKFLDASYCYLNDIKALKTCESLETVFVEGNELTLTNFLQLTDLKHLKVLGLNDNPFDEYNDSYVQIHTIINGVEIRW